MGKNLKESPQGVHVSVLFFQHQWTHARTTHSQSSSYTRILYEYSCLVSVPKIQYDAVGLALFLDEQGSTVKLVSKKMNCNSNIYILFMYTNVWMDIWDGSNIKTHKWFSKQQTALKILMYYGDVTGNPLGSKHGVHEIGALYFVLRNLPPKFNSAVLNNHSVALFHTQDVKKNMALIPFYSLWLMTSKHWRVTALIYFSPLKKWHCVLENRGQFVDARWTLGYVTSVICVRLKKTMPRMLQWDWPWDNVTWKRAFLNALQWVVIKADFDS